MMNSTFGKTFLFLTNLAWKSRVTLPVLITAGFMILNFRWEVEINIHTERIAIQGVDDGRGGGGGGGANRVAGVAAIDYSLEESWESTDEDEDDDEYDEDEETEYDSEGDDEDLSTDDELRRISLVTF
ncbi:conserved hypothetical protein [Culex quinquefasciatus]|uniref:Uncharacterized protein n=2 Tax=Culex pipiens complex TaxID=518105 RepID=B0W0E6_CULQU|nr:zinc finger protein AEBP2-like [Culex pipiens pallens]EDS39685.1 conserved hypothetical protein [Culex quinquefasciatus]|eukprot:XP_001842180.1 conserved hypothetical protein [Culex quinquefasciatus]